MNLSSQTNLKLLTDFWPPSTIAERWRVNPHKLSGITKEVCVRKKSSEEWTLGCPSVGVLETGSGRGVEHMHYLI